VSEGHPGEKGDPSARICDVDGNVTRSAKGLLPGQRFETHCRVSPIDATVSTVSVTEPVPGLTTQGRLDDGQARVLPFAVPPGAAKLDVHLEWQGDWSSYPANDVDLILVQPDGSAVTKNGDRFQLPDRCGRRGAQVALGRAGRPVDLERITSVSRIGRSGSLLEDVRIDAPTGGRWH
jgi:hypothetical protein